MRLRELCFLRADRGLNLKMTSHWGVGPTILMYHSIGEGSGDPYTVTTTMFQDQVSWLLEHGLEPVPLAAIVNKLKSGEYQNLKRKVAFTFDDGYKDFLTTALPILLRHKVSATVFIVTAMLGKKASWSGSSKNVQLMAEDEVQQIKAQGITLGSHSMTHENLMNLSQTELYKQLTTSHARLKDFGETFYAFSFPWGQWSSQILEAVKDSGYECAVTAGGRILSPRTNIYCLPRITIKGDMDLKSFKARFDRAAVRKIKKVGSVMKKHFLLCQGGVENVFSFIFNKWRRR